MARSFNGSDQYLKYSGTILGAFPVTLAGWCYPLSLHNGVILDIRYSGGAYAGDGWDIRVSATGKTRYYVSGQAGGFTDTIVNGATTYSTNTWAHVCGVSSSSSNHVLYFNGTSDGTSSTNVGNAGATLNSIGRYEISGGSGEYFNGYLAEVACWSTNLTADEVAALAKGISPWLIRPNYLSAYWPLWGRHSPERSFVKEDYQMTLNNSPSTADHPPKMIYPRRRGQIVVPAGVPATTTYPQLERGTRGLARGMCLGLAH